MPKIFRIDTHMHTKTLKELSALLHAQKVPRPNWRSMFLDRIARQRLECLSAYR